MSATALPGKLTREKLKALSVIKRHDLYKNAKGVDTLEARNLVAALEEEGLPFVDPTALKFDDPIALKILEIISKPENKLACVAATAKGLPALAGVDAALSKVLGVDYQGTNRATVIAGVLVGQLMRSMGYVKAGERDMPEGSVAKRAAIWVIRSPKAKRAA